MRKRVVLGLAMSSEIFLIVLLAAALDARALIRFRLTPGGARIVADAEGNCMLGNADTAFS